MIESSLVYLIQDDKWLMLLRNKKKNDLNLNKWIGVGGKKLSNETIEECAIRETYEETGLHIQNLDFRGVINFYYENKEMEKITLYTSNDFNGEMHDCNEGTLCWIKQDKILDLELWEGDKIFLKYLFSNKNALFSLNLSYDSNDKLIHSEFGEL